MSSPSHSYHPAVRIDLSATQNAADAVLALLTFDGRIPLERCASSLGIADRALFDAIKDCRPPLLAVKPCDETGVVAIILNSLGRVHLRTIGATAPAYGDRIPVEIVGYCEIAHDRFSRALEECERAEARESQGRLRLRQQLSVYEGRGHLREIVTDICDWVTHVETVCVYLDDRLLISADRLCNLLSGADRAGFFDSLIDKPLERWTSGESTAVCAFYALFQTGKSVRFEEFNGCALTASGLERLLAGYESEYRSAPRVEAWFATGEGDLFDICRDIGDGSRRAATVPTNLRYRLVSGITFNKTERIARDLVHELVEDGDPLRRFRRHMNRFSIRNTFSSERELFFRMGLAAIREPAPVAVEATPACTALEELIELVVASAIDATNADYGMSSSLRSLARIRRPSKDETLSAVLALKPTDFYTCFVATRELAVKVGEGFAKDYSQAVQARMQFNRWHFVPGNFDRPDIPGKRHYFFPPVLPDLAEHSDVFHGGHIGAAVRFSIRCPGPDLHMEPLVVGQQAYRGFYDVRVVRVAGVAFALGDLRRARRRLMWMAGLFDALSKWHEAGGECDICGFTVGEYLAIEVRHEEPALDAGARRVVEA